MPPPLQIRRSSALPPLARRPPSRHRQRLHGPDLFPVHRRLFLWVRRRRFLWRRCGGRRPTSLGSLPVGNTPPWSVFSSRSGRSLVGHPLSKNQKIELSPSMPPIKSGDFLWACMGNKIMEENLFYMLSNGHHSITSSDWILCNSSHDLEPGVFSSFHHFKPIGPLLATNRLSKSAGGLWTADSTCLTWLHQHPHNSVVYAAFGSTTILDTTQFRELALGLELAGRPYLWVVRQNLTGAAAGEEFLAGFKERVGQRGLVVEWAPQQEVLAHPSVGCFMSHCGWNSTVEGVSNGVPFLCWPYFADQFCNRDYICDEWKIGLRLEKDENGIVTREEVRKKVESVVGDGGFKERVSNLRARVMDSVGGGESHANFGDFVDWIKNHNM